MALVYFWVAIATAYLLYCVFPTLFFRLFRKPVLKCGEKEKQILLTFDDGPDKQYTEKILAVLEENKVQAIFFLVAQKVAQCPELTLRIRDSGHMIALHSLAHQSAWGKALCVMKNDFEESLHILKDLGCAVHYYRPPWGLLNLSSIYFAQKYHLKMMLWTVMIQDWEAGSTCERVYRRLKSKVKAGSVICLHDSGEGTGGADGVTAEMITALKRFLPEMLHDGYQFVLTDED